jgi:serine/threonine protein kinase
MIPPQNPYPPFLTKDPAFQKVLENIRARLPTRRGGDAASVPRIPGLEWLAYAGTGTFGSVWYAFSHDSAPDPIVAVKFYKDSKSPEATRQIDNEIQAAEELPDHPHLLRFLRSAPSADVPHLVYPPTNCVLRDILVNWQPSPVHLRTAFMVGTAVAKALTLIHSFGRIHRDVKPDNIHLKCDPQTVNSVCFSRLFLQLLLLLFVIGLSGCRWTPLFFIRFCRFSLVTLVRPFWQTRNQSHHPAPSTTVLRKSPTLAPKMRYWSTLLP